MNWTRIFAAYVPPDVAAGILRQSGVKHETASSPASTESVDYDALPVLVHNVELLERMDAEVIRPLDGRTLGDYLDWAVIDSVIAALDDRFIAILLVCEQTYVHTLTLLIRTAHAWVGLSD